MPQTNLPEEVHKHFAFAAQRHAEWIQKYGHVRPPISQHHAGQTFVAVGSRLFFSPRWKTFHDFLFSYIGEIFKKDWFTDELGLPLEHRHPLMQWYQLWFDFIAAREDAIPKGAIAKVDLPPAEVSALLSFAYDLYTLEHHGLLPQRLVNRLRVKDQFQGARYEAYVAAAFLRAGFTVVLENEADPAATHCEFTATHRETGKTYSVEAKSRHRAGFLGHPGQRKPLDEIEADLSGLLVPALRKEAKYERIVFIDGNMPPSELPTPQTEWFRKVGSQVIRWEENSQHRDLPPAIVFLTNFPYHFVEKFEPLRGQAALFSGFKMPEFNITKSDPALVPRKFPAIFALHDSVLRHTQVLHDLG